MNKINTLLKSINDNVYHLGEKAGYIADNEQYRKLFSSDVLFILGRLKTDILFLEKQYMDVECGTLYNRIKSNDFVIDDYYLGLIDALKDKYFFIKDKTILKERLCDIFNIDVEFDNYSQLTNLKKIDGRYKILLYSGTSEYSKNFHIFMYIISIILFGDVALNLNDDCQKLCRVAFIRIFFPDDLFIKKAEEFNYDCFLLSEFFEFSALCMYVRLVVLQAENKISKDIDFNLNNRQYDY